MNEPLPTLSQSYLDQAAQLLREICADEAAAIVEMVRISNSLIISGFSLNIIYVKASGPTILK